MLKMKILNTKPMKKNLFFLLFFSVLSFAQVKMVSLNPSFINNGVITFNEKDGDDVTWTEITSDNKILFMYPDNVDSQDYIFTRRLANGTIDTTFGNNGYIYTKDLFTNNSDPAILVDKNENIYLAVAQFNTSDSSIYNSKIVKFNSNGIIDTSFGNNGEVILDQIQVQSLFFRNTTELGNGNLLFTTKNKTPNSASNSVICISPTGNLVTSFGTNGSLDFDKLLNTIISDNNSFYVVSEIYSQDDYNNWTYFVDKYDNNGVKDNNFSTITETFSNGSAFLKIDKDGNLLTIVNYTTNTDSNNSIVRKYNITNGSIINSFVNNGTLDFTDIGLVDADFDSSNNILLAGGKNLGKDDFNPYLTKYTSNGVLDTNFNQTGYYEELSNSLGYIDNVRFLNNDIIVSGFTDDYYKVFLASYMLTDILGTKESLKESTSIFPNPVKDILTIKTNGKLIETKIYSIQGNLINHFPTPNKTLNLNHLKKGIYIIEVKTDKGSKSIKFIKE